MQNNLSLLIMKVFCISIYLGNTSPSMTSEPRDQHNSVSVFCYTLVQMHARMCAQHEPA